MLRQTDQHIGPYGPFRPGLGSTFWRRWAARQREDLLRPLASNPGLTAELQMELLLGLHTRRATYCRTHLAANPSVAAAAQQVLLPDGSEYVRSRSRAAPRSSPNVKPFSPKTACRWCAPPWRRISPSSALSRPGCRGTTTLPSEPRWQLIFRLRNWRRIWLAMLIPSSELPRHVRRTAAWSSLACRRTPTSWSGGVSPTTCRSRLNRRWDSSATPR